MDKGSLTGVWHGLYSYPAELEPVYFVATLIDAGTSFHGMTHEATIGREGAPLTAFASIAGARDGSAVDFLKTYDGQGGLDHSIAYAGLMSGDGTEIEGNWRIPGNWSGRFLMIRFPGATESAARRMFQRA